MGLCLIVFVGSQEITLKLILKQQYVLRYIAVAIVLYTAVFFLFSALGNVTDYHSNWLTVHNTLSMTDLPSHAGATWRSIQSSILHTLAFWGIILLELGVALLAFWGGGRLLWVIHASVEVFNEQKMLAFIAFGLAISLYFFGFLAIGSEWFRMWLSPVNHAQTTAFEFTVINLLFLLFLKQTA